MSFRYWQNVMDQTGNFPIAERLLYSMCVLGSTISVARRPVNLKAVFIVPTTLSVRLILAWKSLLLSVSSISASSSSSFQNSSYASRRGTSCLNVCADLSCVEPENAPACTAESIASSNASCAASLMLFTISARSASRASALCLAVIPGVRRTFCALLAICPGLSFCVRAMMTE